MKIKPQFLKCMGKMLADLCHPCILYSVDHVFVFLTVPLPESEYGVQAYGIHADFMLGRHVYQEIYEALQELEIGLLGESQQPHPWKQSSSFILSYSYQKLYNWPRYILTS